MLKNYFQMKDNKNYVEGHCIKINFICLSKLDEIKKKKNCPQNNTKCTQKRVHFFA